MTAATEIPEGYTANAAAEGYDHTVGPIYARRNGPGPKTMGFRIEKRHVNGRGDCHGGMLVGFADISWGMPLWGLYDAGWATIRLMTDFLSNTTEGAWVEGSSELLKRQGDLFTVRGRIWSGERTLLTGTAVYKGMVRRA